MAVRELRKNLSEESELDDHLQVEQKQKNLDAKYANIRELIGKLILMLLQIH